jgi:hypothetical protein
LSNFYFLVFNVGLLIQITCVEVHLGTRFR